jgi:dsRNA-specific ribonuclease
MTVHFDAREEAGDRQKLYYVTVLVNNEAKGEGVGYSKKSAEQAASEMACSALIKENEPA